VIATAGRKWCYVEVDDVAALNIPFAIHFKFSGADKIIRMWHPLIFTRPTGEYLHIKHGLENKDIFM
jgi:uncharacterized membrane-anchored protein